ncbi:ABC transporter ATP-binding protein [Desulfococcus sp.]|uniref:ABC transporter ATP-binding protein n=1 Tax=Desulfococcus sp. TaxID=2025834 RepID=UPI003593F947
MSEIVVTVDNVSKKFCRDLKRSLWYGMKDLSSEILFPHQNHETELRKDEFWAVKDVSFELKRGECVGLIGRNGAGKTTLLRMLNGLIKPDKGRIEMQGRVGALIALGAGFNPVLTGRENIYVNAAVLGLSRKAIETKIDEIVEFAELGEFIDAPVQSYSSGMSVRLGFAVATILEPDILLLDEVLAVGDASFRDKCYHRIATLRKKAAVIFVSHNMDQVARTSTQILVMKNGTPYAIQSVAEGISLYDQLNDSKLKGGTFLSLQYPITAFDAVLSKIKLASCEPLEIRFKVESKRDFSSFLLKVIFYNSAGAFAADGGFQSHDYEIEITRGSTEFKICLASISLKNGKYYLAFNLIDRFGDLIVWSYKNHEVLIYGAYPGAIADCQLKADKLMVLPK